ncbi:MAG TPA: sulfotransferase, partial [Thermoanaerobaculia bacterium]|nr:sulfotransferase [Thermoanaerobaculia bacterium]
MSGRNALSPAEVVTGFVTENTPKFLGQALRLLQSIRWSGGELARSHVVVGVVEQLDPRARRSLEAYGADIRIVPRFHPRNPTANRLSMIEELWKRPEPHYLLLDSDTLVVRDPLPLLRRDVFQAKITPFPTVTHEVFERLFAHFGVPLPPRSYTTGYSGTPTIPYFNAGVISISRALAEKLVPEWRRFNTALADEPQLAAPCEKHIHQAALALALATTKIPVEAAGAELNYQVNATEFPTPRGYAEIDPVIIHYHERVDRDGRLLRVPFPKAQERIELFHRRLAEEQAEGIAIPAREKPAGSGVAKQIAIVGMHRSGTSLVAQLLAAMGAYPGEPADLTPPDVFNPRGYGELSDALTLDDDILAAMNANWREPAEADLARLDERERTAFADRARAIAARLDRHGTWLVKEPRMTLVFPIWREALERLLCVLVWREPAAVARSLMHRDGLPFVTGLALWEEYTRAMLAYTIGLPRVLVSYQDLLRDPV